MKKNVVFLIIVIVTFTAIVGVISAITNKNKNKTDKIEIVATLFPQYDFAKQVGGDKVNVTLLLPPGTESHAYEPTPKDMVTINNSKLFIYTGKEMEPWSEEIVNGMKDKVNVLDLSSTVSLINSEEFEEEHEGEDAEHEHHHEEQGEEHHHEYDPHIWLNPRNAAVMVDKIKDELCNIDPENADYYKENARRYKEEILNIDAEFEEVINKANNKKLAFGGAFAYAYFIERYGLEFESAYESCGENVEPSTAQVKKVIDYIKENNIPVVFYKEYTNGNIARTISENTNAKMLVFNTVHNVSKDEINSGATYVSIMRQNLENIKAALNYE